MKWINLFKKDKDDLINDQLELSILGYKAAIKALKDCAVRDAL